MRRVRVVAVLLLCALGACGLGGCGGGSSDTISDAARRELEPMTASVRRALVTYDPTAAATALDRLDQAVDRLHARGAIGDARAADIRRASSRVRARLSLAPTTTTTTTTVPRPPPTVQDHGKGKGKGNGQGDEG
jgi:hypothetical protein